MNPDLSWLRPCHEERLRAALHGRPAAPEPPADGPETLREAAEPSPAEPVPREEAPGTVIGYAVARSSGGRVKAELTHCTPMERDEAERERKAWGPGADLIELRRLT